MLMRALITQRESVDRYGVAIDTLESSYIRYFESLGYGCFPVSNYVSDVGYLFGIEPDLLVLTGGGSVSGQYCEPVREGEEMPCRDRVEKALFEEALRRNIPVVAICRGMQYVNSLMGGSISGLSDMPVHRPVGEDHPVSFGNFSVSRMSNDGLARRLPWRGKMREVNDTLLVNNYHNDGIYAHQLADGLVPLCMDRENGVVEAYASREHRILGVQFHPERKMSDPCSARKIRSLIQDFIR